MTLNIQDTNLSWYVPKANMDHTIRGQGTADSTLDHSASTPRTIGVLHGLSAVALYIQYPIYYNNTRFALFNIMLYFQLSSMQQY